MSARPGRAILAADAVAYSRLMAQDEEATLRRLHEYRKIFNGIVNRHGGTVFGVAGDSEMAIFGDAEDAVRCGLELQETIGRRNSVLPKTSRMPIRVGINFGPVIAEDDDVYGDEVNVTARLESFAEAGEVCISGAVFDLVRGKLECGFDFFGKQRFKNIDRPVRAYRVRTDPQAVGQVISAKRRRPQPGRYWRLAAAVSLVALLGATVWGAQIQIEKQQASTAAEKLILETRQSVGDAEDQIERLLESLQRASDKAANDGKRVNALIALLQQAQDTAETQQRLSQRRSAEIRRLLELLDASESRAAAERARADDLFKAMQEAEQKTAAQDHSGWDESLSKDAKYPPPDQDLRETLLGSWREAEQQAALSQSRAEKLLAIVNKLEAVAPLGHDAVADDVALPGDPGAQISGERQRIEAFVASLREAQTIATGKREQAEDLLARLKRAEVTVADNDAVIQTLRQEIAKIESLLADLMTFETNIAEDVSSAENTLKTLRKTEAAARSQTQTLFDPEPADRLGQTLDQTVQVLAAAARLVHVTRAKGLSPQEKRIPSQMTVHSASVFGPNRSPLSHLARNPAWNSTALGSSEDIGDKEAGQSSEDEIQALAFEDQRSLAQSQHSTPALGIYDGHWTLWIHLNGYVGSDLEIPVEVISNAFNINTVVSAWNVILAGSMDEVTGRMAAAGRVWTNRASYSRNVKNLIDIEARFLDGKFSGETLIASSRKSNEFFKFTLVPSQEILQNIAAFEIKGKLGTSEQSTRELIPRSYDGKWIVRLVIDGPSKTPFEAEFEIKDNSFQLNTVANGYGVYLNGVIDEGANQVRAIAQVRQLFGSGAGSGSRKVGGIFEINSVASHERFSGTSKNNKGARMEIPNSLHYTFLSEHLQSSTTPALGPTMRPVTDPVQFQNSVSVLYDGPWVVRFDLSEFGFRKDALIAELDIRNGSFVTEDVTSSWRVYFAGQIDDGTGKLSATGQIRDHQRETKVRGIFKTESSLVDGAYSGIARMNTGTRMGLPQHVKYTIVRKELPEQMTAVR